MNSPSWAQSFEPSAALIAMNAVKRMNIIMIIEKISPKDSPMDCWDFLLVGMVFKGDFGWRLDLGLRVLDFRLDFKLWLVGLRWDFETGVLGLERDFKLGFVGFLFFMVVEGEGG
jgi:hypothetical protein